MGNHAVTLKVTPSLRIECKFWLTDDGWNGSCEQPSITVQAGSFEHAKSEMELALGKYVESLLREPQRTSTRAGCLKRTTGDNRDSTEIPSGGGFESNRLISFNKCAAREE
jgi:hypothetical protein